MVVSEEKDKGERPRMGEGGSVCRAAALRPPRAAGLLISSSCVALPKWAMVFGDGRSPPHVLPSLATKTKKTSFMKLVSLRSRPDRRPPRGPRRRGAGRSHGASAVSVRSWMLRPLVQKNQSKALFFEVVTF